MGFPIRAFVGPNGGGKTLAGVALEVVPALLEGREVVATCRINHPNARLLESWRELPTLKNCLLFLDEISSQLPSRQSMSLPPQLVRKVNQLRKDDVSLVWTAPNWARADVVLREVTQSVTVCRGFLGDSYQREPVVPPVWRLSPPRKRSQDGSFLTVSPRWRSNRLFRWVTYDATAFEEFSLHAVRDVRPVERFWYYRPWQSDQFLYDTFNPVMLLDHVDDVGVCIVCGGRRTRQSCTCARSGASPEVASATVGDAPEVHDA